MKEITFAFSSKTSQNSRFMPFHIRTQKGDLTRGRRGREMSEVNLTMAVYRAVKLLTLNCYMKVKLWSTVLTSPRYFDNPVILTADMLLLK